MLVFLLYLVAAFYVFAMYATVAMIGKPRKPTTPGQAAFLIPVQLGILAIIIFAAEALRSYGSYS